MDIANLSREVQRHITEATASLETEDYIWFMRELAEWCETQAAMQEFKDDFTNNDDE